MMKLNNRGFAISTLLYGLMIMSLLVVVAYLGNLSTDRQNTKGFVDKIEDELNRLSVTSTEGSYTGDEVDSMGREYIAPNNGWYKIELWGAGSGSGLGSYVSGVMYMNANDYLYVYVGAKGGSSNTFNSGSKGGGATDVRLVNGEWNSDESLKTRIMVAAGAGGGTTSDNSGGALVGFGSTPGTQNSGYNLGIASGNGGGGYYGGNPGGGSSMIMGYAGTMADSTTKQTTKELTGYFGNYYDDGTPEESSITPKIYNGLIVAGVNADAGKFKITQISSNGENNPPRMGMNTKLNNVTGIRDCVSDSTGRWSEIQAINMDGENILLKTSTAATNGNIVDSPPTTITASTDVNGSRRCITYNFNGTNLAEVAVWHTFNNKYSPSKHVSGHVLQVQINGKWEYLRNTTAGQANEKETSNGIHYHSMQIDSMQELPEGNYYIFPADSHNKVLTSLNQGSADVLASSLFTGDDSQIWHVYKDGSGYKIESTETRNVCNYYDDPVENNTKIYVESSDKKPTKTTFTIKSLGNGYYSISYGSKYFTTNTSNGGILKGATFSSSNLKQRFKFVLADY